MKSNTHKTLGIAIPYFQITIQCKDVFKILLERIKSQLNDDMILYIYEDGQRSQWLYDFKFLRNNIIVESDILNRGVSYARNKCVDYLINKVDYILFLDSDDMIDGDYLENMLNACKKSEYDIYESGFYTLDVKAQFNPNVIRNGVAGSAISSKLIGSTRFDEHLQIGEDTKFMTDIFDLSKNKKQYVDTNYYYQIGINEHSLIMRYNKKMIGKER